MSQANTDQATLEPGATPPTEPARPPRLRPGVARVTGPDSGNVSVAELAAKYAKARSASSRSVASPSASAAPVTPAAASPDSVPGAEASGGSSDAVPAAAPEARAATVDVNSDSAAAAGLPGPSPEAEPLPLEASGLTSPDASTSAPSEGAGALEDLGVEPGSELAEILAEAKLPKGVEKLVKRLNRLGEQRDAERNARLELERRLAQGQRSPAASEASAPLAAPTPAALRTDPEMRAIAAGFAEIQQIETWAAQNPDGGTLADGRGGQIMVDAPTLRAALAQAAERRQELKTQAQIREHELRKEEAQQRAQSEAEARQAYGYLTKPEAPEHKEFTEHVSRFPQIQALPDWQLWVGDALVGRRLRLQAAARQQQNPQPRRVAANGQPAPQPGALASAPMRTVQGPQQALQQAQQAYEQTGRVKDLAQKYALRRRQIGA